MKVKDLLAGSAKALETAGIGTARLDTLVLLEDVTGRDRAWLLAHPEFAVPAAQTKKLNNLLKQRVKHIPLAYIRGRTEFYGREFLLTHDVLEPRPESETMIDLLKELIKNGQIGTENLLIGDIGTGSGALGITAALELPNSSVELIELDEKALNVAKMNVDLFTLRLKLIQSDLLAGTSAGYGILLCNLPYVPDSFHINPAAMREPKLAIFGGPDGLDIYRKLFKQIKMRSEKPLYILSEAMPPQHAGLARIAGTASYKLLKSRDFIQLFEYQK